MGRIDPRLVLAYFIGGSVGAMFIVIVVVTPWLNLLALITVDKAADWAQAVISGVAILVGAAGIGWRTWRQRQHDLQDRRDLAIVTAAEVVTPLLSTSATFRGFLKFLRAAEVRWQNQPVDLAAQEARKMIVLLGQSLKEQLPGISKQDLALLVPVGRRLAAQGARGLANLHALERQIATVVAPQTFNNMTPPNQMGFLVNNIYMLEDALTLIYPLVTECMRIVGMAAPIPDGHLGVIPGEVAAELPGDGL